jgi:chemotaxis protein CheX
MDEAVGEVFSSMLYRSCTALADPLAVFGDFSARISISGTFEANCSLEFPSRSAECLTDALLGTGLGTYDDAMMTDAVGELCNMIVGGWKRRLGEQSAGLALSLPFPCNGSCHAAPAKSRIRRTYAFDDSHFVLSLEQF